MVSDTEDLNVSLSVGANIWKLSENPSLEKVVFQLVSLTWMCVCVCVCGCVIDVWVLSR